MEFRDEGAGKHWKIVFALVLAELVSSFEASMIYAGLAEFYRLFGDPVAVGWLVTGYMLVATSAAAICSRLGDIYGRKRVLIVCLIIACGGSIISALSSELIWIIVGRSCQGIAGAILPLCYGMVREYMPRVSVSLNIGIVSATASGGAGVGLVAGGILVDNGAWYSIFIASAILAAVAALVVWWLIPPSREKNPGKIDWVGGLLFVPGLSLILYAIGLGKDHGWGSSEQLMPLCVGIVIGVGWFLYERRIVSPMVDLRLLLNRPIGLSVLVIMLLGLGTMNMPQVVMVMLQQPVATGPGLGISATLAGMLSFPGAVIGVIASPLCGWFAARKGSRGAMILATFAATVAWTGLALMHDTVVMVTVWMWLNSFALGAAMAAVPNLIVEAAPLNRTSEATGLAQIGRKIAMATGAQGMAVLLATSMVKTNGGAFPDQSAYQATYWTIAAICGLSLIVSMRLPVRKIEAEKSAPDRAAAA